MNDSPRRISTDDLLKLYEELVSLQEATDRDWFWSPLSNQLFADISDISDDQVFVRLRIYRTNWLDLDLAMLGEIDYDREHWTSSYSDSNRCINYSARGSSPLESFVNMCLVLQDRDPELAESILSEGFNE